MDELFSFCTDRQDDIHRLHQICIPSDDDDEDKIGETKKRSRTGWPADLHDLDKVTGGRAGGGVDAKRRRPWNDRLKKKKKRGRRFLDEDSEDEDGHSNSSSSSSSDDETDGLVLSSTSSSPYSSCLAPPQVQMDDDCRELLREAHRAITDFRDSPVPCLDSTLERSCQSPVEVIEDGEFTLRVRCQGKVHQCRTRMEDPLSLVARQLSSTLSVDVYRILLQWKTTDLDPVDTPAKLGISAVDILDAYVMDESTALPDVAGANSISDENAMTIKIQTTKKCSKYRVKEGEKLERVMSMFAAELGLRLEQLKFTFDGETISRNNTTEDLDMAEDDVIDATPT